MPLAPKVGRSHPECSTPNMAFAAASDDQDGEERMPTPMFGRCFADSDACSSDPDIDQEGGVAPTFGMKVRILGEVQQPSCKQHTQDLYTLISFHMHNQETQEMRV